METLELYRTDIAGTLQHARYHSRTVALRIKARLEGIAKEPYLV